MRRFVLGIIILIVSVWVGLKIAEDPGVALFSWRDWSVEMPLWLFIFCFTLLMLIFYFVISFSDRMSQIFYRWKNWRRFRLKQKSGNKTGRGLLELIEGRWKLAENDLLEGVSQSDAPLINYLAAAKAAHEQAAYEKRDTYLRKAHDLAPQAVVAIGLTEVQLQMEQGQLEQALATLNHLRTVAPKQDVVLTLLKKIYIQLADWKNLLALLPLLRKRKLLTDEQADKLEQHAYEKLLDAAEKKAVGLSALQDLWRTMPKKSQTDARLIYCYTKQLLNYPEAAATAEELIYKSLRKSLNEDLIRLYGLLTTSNPSKQLTHTEKWLGTNDGHAVLLLTAGRLCMRCQLWGKARSYFEESLALKKEAETYLEYAGLLEQLGEHETAKQNYREGLKLLGVERSNNPVLSPDRRAT